MQHHRVNIISIIILLFSWSLFTSPALSSSLDNQLHHEVSMELMPCHDDNCNMQPSTSCAKHCEALSSVIALSLKKELSPQISPKLFANDQASLQYYSSVELKPPKNNLF